MNDMWMLDDYFNVGGKYENKIDDIEKFNQKFNEKLQKMLFEIINIKALALEGLESQEQKFRKSFDDFWRPIFDLEKNKKKREELINLKQKLDQDINKVQNDPNLMKFQKKEKIAEIQKNILSIKKELEDIGKEIKHAELIFYLILNYQKDFENFKKENLPLEDELKIIFKQKWVSENLENLYKNLSKTLLEKNAKSINNSDLKE